MGYNVNEMMEYANDSHGYEILTEKGFTVTRGARKPETHSTLEVGRRAMKALPGSTLTYNVKIPARERMEVLARLATAYPARKQ